MCTYGLSLEGFSKKLAEEYSECKPNSIDKDC